MMNMVEQAKSRGVEMPEKIRHRLGLRSSGQSKVAIETAAIPEMTQFRFEKPTVWQCARRLSAEIYTATQSFPKDELFGLTSQSRRAAVSIVANIAEGCGRNSDADFAHFLEIAYGSTMELAALLHVATDIARLNAATRDRLLDLVAEVSAQLVALNHSLGIGRSKTPFTQHARS
jgi:four helix bundle protein